MNTIDITARLENIDFHPNNIYTEIIQNIKTILSTSKFSVPLDREFGLNITMLDAPLKVAQAKLTAEIIAAIKKYEPRVLVKKVFYQGDALDGILIPVVRVVIK